MTPTLSPQQREALHESVRAAIWSCRPFDCHEAFNRATDSVLDAALPAIIGAVWLEAAKVARGCGWGAFNEGEAEACRALQSDIAESLEARALAEEARNGG